MDVNVNFKTSLSQRRQIQNYLENGHTLTALTALNLFGSLSFAKRISEIVADGFFVAKQWVVTPSGKRIIEYSMPRVEFSQSKNK